MPIGSAPFGQSSIFDTKLAATSGNVTKRRFVKLASDTTVTRGTLGAKCLGIAGDTVADGYAVSAIMFGESEIELGGTVAAGGLLMSDASGLGIAYANGGAGTTYYAVAYALAGGDSGEVVRCFVYGYIGGNYGITGS